MRKMTVFGWVDANVGTREEMITQAEECEGTSYYLVARLEDTDLSSLPLALRRAMMHTVCEKCGEVCVYHPDHYVIHTTIVCTHCSPTDTVNYIPEEALKLVNNNLAGVFRAHPLRSDQ